MYKICKMYWEAFARGIDTLGEGKVHRSSADAQAIALLIPRQNAYEGGMVIIGCCLAQQWTLFHCHSDINSGCWFNQKLWYNYIERIREKEVCACVRFTAMTESLQCLRLPGKHILCRKFAEASPWDQHLRTGGSRVGQREELRSYEFFTPSFSSLVLCSCVRDQQ